MLGFPNIVQTSLEYVNSTKKQSCVVINNLDINRVDIIESIEVVLNYIKKNNKNKVKKLSKIIYMHRRYRRSPRKMTKQEEFQWILTAVVFTFFFALYFLRGLIFNCIFEWPIRWDVISCSKEQVNPAKYKAAEKAAPFLP